MISDFTPVMKGPGCRTSTVLPQNPTLLNGQRHLHPQVISQARLYALWKFGELEISPSKPNKTSGVIQAAEPGGSQQDQVGPG